MVNACPLSRNPSEKIWEEGTNVKCRKQVVQWRYWQRWPHSPDGASLVVVNLALWLWNFGADSYLTPCPMMGQPPSIGHPRGLAESSCLSAGREWQRVQMSLHMCNDPELDSLLNFWHLAMAHKVKVHNCYSDFSELFDYRNSRVESWPL